MAKYLEIRRHTDNDGDVLTDEGVEAAVSIGTDMNISYHLGVSSGAQRATQSLACMLAGSKVFFPRGVVVEPTLRSENEDRWKDIAKSTGASSVEEFHAQDAAFVDAEAERLASGLRAVLDRLDEEQRALIVGHSPTNEAAVYGLTGEFIDSMDKGDGILLVQMGDSFRRESLV